MGMVKGKRKFQSPALQYTYDRYIVRLEEMRQSRLICLQAIENIPAGPIMGKVGKVLKPPPGEVYFPVEGANGELGFYLVSDGTGRPYRCRVRPPCFTLMQGLQKMLKGGMVADIVPTFGMINMIGGECDR